MAIGQYAIVFVLLENLKNFEQLHGAFSIIEFREVTWNFAGIIATLSFSALMRTGSISTLCTSFHSPLYFFGTTLSKLCALLDM